MRAEVPVGRRRRLARAGIACALAAALGAGAQPSSRLHLFEPDIFNFEGWTTYKPVFTRDGRTAYFTVEGQGRPYTILVSRLRNGRWTPAELAPFSGRWPDAEPFLSPDGKQLFFASRRPDEGQEMRPDFDLFVMDRRAEGWSEPRRLGLEVNSPAWELHPAVTRSGTLFFARYADRKTVIWKARAMKGGYETAEALPAPVNVSGLSSEGVFAPADESFLLFEGRRPGGRGSNDLFISRRVGEGWSEPVMLPISSAAHDSAPVLSPDGSRLYVATNAAVVGATFGKAPFPSAGTDASKAARNWHVYWVPAAEGGIPR